MEETDKRRLRHLISMLALASIEATARDGAEVDLDIIVEKHLAHAGIFHGLDQTEIWEIAGEAFKELRQASDASLNGDNSLLERAIIEIKEWGFEKTALAVVASILFADGDLGDAEGLYFGGLGGHFGADAETQTHILIGVYALLRQF